MKAGTLILMAATVAAYGQDAASMAATQSMQAAQMANDQAMQASQIANQQAMQAGQQAAQDTGGLVGLASRPAFSVRPGPVTDGTIVRLKSSTRHSVIYYTTDGWTPTVSSTRYTGPIHIDQNTHLQAIAVAPEFERSLIAVADYTVAGQAPTVPPSAVETNGTLRAGTALRLVTGSVVSSKTAQVGDTVSMLLDEDVKVGDSIAIPKGATVNATISAVDRSGHLGAPGDLAFEVHSIKADGFTIPLQGTESLEGLNKVSTVRHLVIIPGVGATALLIRGKDAEIKPGMALTASVATDTPLNASLHP